MKAGSSAPSSSRPEEAVDGRVAELNFEVPPESRKTHLPPVNSQIIPDELLVSLTSTVCNKSTLGHTAHHRHCKGCGIRRPDAVWHHPFGRKKYKYFLEQPTSLTGAGRDISFLCDAMVTQKKTTPLPPLTDKSGIGDTQNISVSESLIPDEYHIVKNKGLRSLELYEDAFTVQLQDEEQKLRVFPSLRPSGRVEVVQLMKMMDDMLVKAGVDQQSEELTEISQMEGLLELVQVEQNIYNIVFHELIRQVSVSCSERGELLAKLRQRYQSLLERIPRLLKALHTETVAQRALDRRLTEEIYHIKTSIQNWVMENKINFNTKCDHVSLSNGPCALLSVVQGYHQLYELQRGRLEAQLLQMTEERDYWSQLTFCLALKVISVKKLQLISRLHISEQNWSKTAEHCSLYVTSKDTEDLNVIIELTDYWKEQLTALMSQLKKTEHSQCEHLSAIQCSSSISRCPDPKYEKASLEKIQADFKQWSSTLACQCECYQGERLLCCQQTLGELGCVQQKWLNMSLQLFRRHLSPDGEPPGGQQALRELDKVLSELLKQLDTQVTGETGIHGQMTSLLGLMESWVSKLATVIDRPEMMSVSDWLRLEKALCNWQSLSEEALQNVCIIQTKNKMDKNKPDIFTEAEKVSDKVQEFITNLSNFTDGESQRLSEEVRSIHMAQTRWMLDLLLLMVPDHSDDQNQEQEHHYNMNISLQTLDEDAKMLAEKLDYFSRHITSPCKLILEEQVLQNSHEVESENEMNECRKLQVNNVLMQNETNLFRCFKSNQLENVSIRKNEIFALFCPKICSAEGLVKLIGYDGNITQRKLGESSIHLSGTEELVVSPVTDEAQKAFSDLTTVGLLQQELHDSELQVQSAEQRALKAEEALQAALEKIQDLETQLQGQPSLEPKSKKKKTPTPSPLPVTPPAPPKKTTAEAKTSSSTKRTKKR
uniref:Axonemal dynein light chain domain containing 1 n=1 Tax=Dicentrarchus labrax TaxID=13489 RepID=A0A8C4H9N1_DICLA